MMRGSNAQNFPEEYRFAVVRNPSGEPVVHPGVVDVENVCVSGN